MEPTRVLFLCTHNSARSQMAEGMLRVWGGERFDAFSAGTEATRVRPEAIEVMREIGLDIGAHESKTVDRFLGQPIDWLVTVCDDAREACPTLPGVRQSRHWSIDDPSGVDGDAKRRLAAFRSARDQLGRRVRAFISEVGTSDSAHSQGEYYDGSVPSPPSRHAPDE